MEVNLADQRRLIIEQIETEVLIRLLLEKFPDMPSHLKDGLNSLSRESLVEHVLTAMQDATIVAPSQKDSGVSAVIYVRVKKIEVKTLDEVFGKDDEMKNICMKISSFLKGKDQGKLSVQEKKELAAINKNVLAAFAEKYPELQANFCGFRISDDGSEVLLGFKIKSK